MHNHHYVKYRNIILFVVGFIVAILLFRIQGFKLFVQSIGNLGYLGAFIAGLLFVSTFTVAMSSIILVTLSQSLPIPLVILVAGMGAVIGDLLIFRFIKDNVADEITPIYNELVNRSHIKKILHTKYFSWTLPVFGAIIIASPLPDEMGISLINLSKMSTFKFVLLSYILNSIGIFLIVSASIVIKL